MQVPENAEDYVEVHRTDDQAEALRMVEVLLRPAGVDAVVHDRTSHALPAPASQPGGYFIAVPSKQRDKALELLRQDAGLT